MFHNCDPLYFKPQKVSSECLFQKIYTFVVLLLILFNILEILYNNSGGAKLTAGSVCICSARAFAYVLAFKTEKITLMPSEIGRPAISATNVNFDIHYQA